MDPEFRKIYEASFGDSREWVDWMMRRVYSPTNALLSRDDRNRAVSGVLLRPYECRFLDTRGSMSYLYAACTLPQARGQGRMHGLVERALNLSRDRGDLWCSLIPANSALYYFYESFGFARAVFVDRQRYTAVHRFEVADGYEPVECEYDDFARLESMGLNTVLHTRQEYEIMVEDLLLEGGCIKTVGRDSRVEALAVAVPYDHGVVSVKALFVDSGDPDGAAAEAALAEVRRAYGEQLIVVDCFPGRRGARLESRGMMRVIDAERLLGAVAAYKPDLKLDIRVTDRMLPHNSGNYRLRDGRALRVERLSRPDIEATDDVLARILCSGPHIAGITGVPAAYARLPLMLD